MLSSQTAIVTGASRGIGWAIAQKLASVGCSVTLVAKNEDLLKKNLADLPRDSNQLHNYVLVDLVNLKSSAPSYKSLQKSFEGSSILVNCAGATTHALLSRISEDSIKDIVALNLTAPILLSKMALTPMRKVAQKSAITPQILNVGSMISCIGLTIPGTVAYSALKAGLLGLTESLAAELRGKIRVNAVLPALVPETDMGKLASQSLPKVKLDTVVEECMKVIEGGMNGEFIKVGGETTRARLKPVEE